MKSRLALYLFSLFLISACASLSPLSTEETIANNVKTRWDALIQHNWSDAYQFQTSGYRDSHTLEQYKTKFGRKISWQEVKVSKIQLNEEKTKATVSVLLPYQTIVPGMGLQESEVHLTEIWLLDDAEWKHYTE